MPTRSGFYPVIERDSHGFPVRVRFVEYDPISEPIPDSILGRYTDPFAIARNIASDALSAGDSVADSDTAAPTEPHGAT